MGLGPDNEMSKTEFIEAMRARLEAEETGLGANVDEPSVQNNLGALGQAVYRIATIHAETHTDSLIDNDFWQWIEDVHSWLSALRTWQRGIDEAFNDWVPTTTAEQNLRTAIIDVSSPGPPPSLRPTSLRGRIR